ncbi:Hypothetical predicted protein [Pelobates cultripes]|uniref:Uncharacterized protein n=1 Tax=Pelobates cultripes TaxID=61616 RepID=A0AAD1R548_PELCU|nr:Hypothetical predicted protein [Pelobates cultripes]
MVLTKPYISKETHLKVDGNLLLKNRHYPLNFYSNHPTMRKTGTAILIAANLQFAVTNKLTDADGRYLFVKGEMAGKTYTIANMYAPNLGQASFVRRTLRKLDKFTEGVLILGDDLKFPLYPLVDTRSTKTTWRLNDTLLDEPLRAQIDKHIRQYFEENTTDDLPDMTIWEAHKSVLRGHLI